MTLVKSLHSGDHYVICPDDSEYADLQVPDVLAAGRCFADALQVLFCLHPNAVHVCSMFIYVHVTHALGGAMFRAFSTGRTLICTVDVPNSY